MDMIVLSNFARQEWGDDSFRITLNNVYVDPGKNLCVINFDFTLEGKLFPRTREYAQYEKAGYGDDRGLWISYPSLLIRIRRELEKKYCQNHDLGIYAEAAKKENEIALIRQYKEQIEHLKWLEKKPVIKKYLANAKNRR